MSNMTPHSDYEKLQQLLPYVREYQALAEKHGISDIFQDNGGKILQMLLLTGLSGMKKREGNDATNEGGEEFELKTVNVKLTKSVSTNHHLNLAIINKYRKAKWVFAVYENIELKEIWTLTPDKLKHLFDKWEDKWNATQTDINNPKIPLSLVISEGVKYYPSVVV